MNLWRRRKYKLWVSNCCVFMQCLRPIREWGEAESESYLRELRRAIKGTVSPEVWSLLTGPEACDNPAYRGYVESVKSELIREYGLESVAEQVTIDLYHADSLVISFPAEAAVEYPYYFKGIQLKPIRSETE